MGETLISIQVLCNSFVVGCNIQEVEWLRAENPKTSFTTKLFKIFFFSLEHAVPRIFLLAMGKKPPVHEAL